MAGEEGEVDLDRLPDEPGGRRAEMAPDSALYDPADSREELDETPNSPGSRRAAEAPESALYNRDDDRERKRGEIALRLVWLLGFVVVGGLLLTLVPPLCARAGVAACGDFSVEDIKPMVEALITPLVGLVGAVTGFYFGSNKT